MITEYHKDRLVALKARLGEDFDDYLLLVRVKKNEMVVLHSDSNWAVGAASRFLGMMKIDNERNREEL